MARSKRQYIKPEEIQSDASPLLPVWETAIYARLSIENSKKNDDGDSIEGQVEICRDYIAEHPYLHLADTFVDNGWTGVNTDRPEFQRMLAEIREGRIKALVIKDFSRFSRNYIEAGNLLENIFPSMGVRFISVVDHYDSFETDGSAGSLLIPLKNLINSFYSKDQSKKVSLAIHAKQLAGEHIPSMIPYGYRKSTAEAYRFEPDPETAPVVRQIFQWYVEGHGVSAIKNKLNDAGVPSPGKLRYMRGLIKRQCYSDCIWSAQGIKQILMNPTYLGNLVFGRMPTALYLGKPNYYFERDESKWRILPNMHEALVSPEDFKKANEILEGNRRIFDEQVANRTDFWEKHPQLFKTGMLRCGYCSSNLGFLRAFSRNTFQYHCRNKQYGRCTDAISVNEKNVATVVWNAIQMQFALFANFQEVAQRIKDTGLQTAKQQELHEAMHVLNEKLSLCQKKRTQLYDDYADGLLSAGDYMELKRRFDNEYQDLSAQRNHLSAEIAKLNRMLSAENKWMVNVQNIRKARKLTPEIAEAMIDHVTIYKEGRGQYHYEIIFRFQEERDALIKAYEELRGEKT